MRYIVICKRCVNFDYIDDKCCTCNLDGIEYPGLGYYDIEVLRLKEIPKCCPFYLEQLVYEENAL